VKNEKKNKEIGARAWKLPKTSPSKKKYICSGAHHTIFATSPLIYSYVTAAFLVCI
jgi:hypothetical protein